MIERSRARDATTSEPHLEQQAVCAAGLALARGGHDALGSRSAVIARRAARVILPWVLGVVLLGGSCTKHDEVPLHARFIDGDVDANADVTEMVKTQRAKSAALGRRLLIYVGATWCEPCQRFHEAAAQGQLDDMLAKIDLLAFDLDKDRARLTAAGCDSNMIPLLSLPDDFGRCTDHRIEGSIKGSGAVAQMTPRLQELLASPR